MPRLDRFIEILYQREGDCLGLATEEKIDVTVNGTASSLSRDPLTREQVAALVREIAPAELHPQLANGGGVTFHYSSPSGPVEVRVERGSAGLSASLHPAAAEAPTPSAADSPHSAETETACDLTDARDELHRLLAVLVDTGGSDLHLRVNEPPILRTEGRLERQEDQLLTEGRLTAMLKAVMLPQDHQQYRESGDFDFAHELQGVARFRCNAALDRHGPAAVFRVIPHEIPTCDQLDLSREVQNLCFLSKGLVLVTGPTGSGKSTTLAALVDLMNRERRDHILTIEDPIEFVHSSKKCLVTQRQVGLHTKSFKTGLRAALREDPDIILIGEMRDLETVEIAIETAETGHLVFGTLHTTTAPSTVDRIIDQFPADRQSQIRVMLSESLRGVIAQNLCRKNGGGRVAAREILLSIPAMRNLVREGKTYQLPSIIQTNRKLGMMTLNDSLIRLVEENLVDPKEAYIKAADKAEIESALRAKGHDMSFLKTEGD